jgi:hypothetical protein
VSYKKIPIDVDNAIGEFREARESDLVHNGNLSKFYRFVNKKLRSQSTFPPLKIIESNTSDTTCIKSTEKATRPTNNKVKNKTINVRIVTDSSEKAVLFNKYFASNFTRDNNKVPVINPLTNGNVSINSTNFPYNTIKKVLEKLPSKCSLSPDGFTAFFLKNIASEAAVPLSFLFELSMKTGEIPLIWKKGIIRPFHKKGPASTISNYRPISLTCICSKVMESVIANNMLTYLRANNLISKSQFGFLSKRSTCTQQLDSLEDWVNAFNNKLRTDVIFVDLAKAFDSVCHTKLIHKLSSFGIKYELLDWITNFLSKRSQQVLIDECMSDLEHVVSGVPQGSVLGPILFLLYVNDIDTCCDLPSKAKTFADDTKFYQSYLTIEEITLHYTFSNLEKWAQDWQLQIEQTKCYHLCIGDVSIPTTTYSIISHEIDTKKSIDDLGIILTSDLKFSTHCDAIASKAFSRANLILKAFSSNNQNILVTAFITYVRPILEYNSCTWNPYLLKDIEKIEAVQRFITRKICMRCKICYDSYTDRLRILNLQSLEFRRLKADIVMTYKIIHGLVDLDKNKFFNFRQSKTRGNP